MNRRKAILKLVLSGLFLGLALVMPFLTGQIPQIGAMLCPMHIPVLLCGFFCGPLWGGVIGLIAPILRSLTLGMPPLFPTAVCMALELLTYGAVSGVMHKILPKKKGFIYLSLIVAMLVGRGVWGIAMLACTSFSGGTFAFSAFLAGAFINAIPGIIVQLVLIPILVMVLDNPKILNRNR
ncbi:MAG: ECF transporter S component [Clostridia bacterium]|nr:ECF transporter S component [Clostridia bacterium]